MRELTNSPGGGLDHLPSSNADISQSKWFIMAFRATSLSYEMPLRINMNLSKQTRIAFFLASAAFRISFSRHFLHANTLKSTALMSAPFLSAIADAARTSQDICICPNIQFTPPCSFQDLCESPDFDT
jgi:hypothetical protein